jgi:pyruvate kinase
MVARGDLGVESFLHMIPLVQRFSTQKPKWPNTSYCSDSNDGNNDNKLNSTKSRVNDACNFLFMDSCSNAFWRNNGWKLSVQSNQKMTQKIIEAVEDSPLIQVPQTHHRLKTTKRFITKTICEL